MLCHNFYKNLNIEKKISLICSLIGLISFFTPFFRLEMYSNEFIFSPLDMILKLDGNSWPIWIPFISGLLAFKLSVSKFTKRKIIYGSISLISMFIIFIGFKSYFVYLLMDYSDNLFDLLPKIARGYAKSISSDFATELFEKTIRPEYVMLIFIVNFIIYTYFSFKDKEKDILPTPTDALEKIETRDSSITNIVAHTISKEDLENTRLNYIYETVNRSHGLLDIEEFENFKYN
jgi:hypothetical protein